MKNDVYPLTFSFYYDVITYYNDQYLIVYSHKSYESELIEFSSAFYVKDNILYVQIFNPTLFSKIKRMLQKKLVYPLREIKKTWSLNNIKEIDGVRNSKKLFYQENPNLFLFEITFILNHMSPDILPEYHYPYSNNIPNLKDNIDLDLDYIKLYTNKYHFPNLTKISILGDNLFKIPNFYQVLEYCQLLGLEIHIYLKYSDYVNNLDTLKHLNVNIDIYCDELYDFHLNNNIIYTDFLNKSLRYYYSIRDTSKLLSTVTLLNQHNLSVQFFPSLILEKSMMGELLTFRRDKVLNRELNRNKLFRNYLMNDYFFGNLIVDNSGTIWTSFLQKSLGSLQNHKMDDLIQKAADNKSIWMLSRSKFDLCKNCVYNIFCPPLSSYEIIHNQIFCK